MSYSIETETKADCELDFPEGLSTFFESYGGYEENSEVGQIEKILDIDLSAFQNTYNEFEYEGFEMQKELGNIKNPKKEFEKYEKKSWQSVDSIYHKLGALINKIENDTSFYKKIRYSESNINSQLDSVLVGYQNAYFAQYARLLNSKSDSSKRLVSIARSSSRKSKDINRDFETVMMNDSLSQLLITNLQRSLSNPELQYPERNEYISGGFLKKDLSILYSRVGCIKEQGIKKMRFLYY